MSSESKCPFAGGAGSHVIGGAPSNATWWPNQLNLAILHQHSAKSNPLGATFNYAEEFKKLDLEAWKAEVDNLQDSIDAYNYSRQITTKDSVQYMVNVYHEGDPCYQVAHKAWIDQFDGKVFVVGSTLNVDAMISKPKNTKGQAMNAAPVKPNAADYSYSNAAARIQWNFVRDYTDAAANLVYTKFYDLIADYFQNAPFGKDSTTANGGYYANYIAGVVVPNMDTIRINATVDMKDFILKRLFHPAECVAQNMKNGGEHLIVQRFPPFVDRRCVVMENQHRFEIRFV